MEREYQILTVSNRHLCERDFLEQIERICRGEFLPKPDRIILREKDLSEEEYFQLAGDVQKICKAYEMPLTLHNYAGVAKRLGVRSIHLPLWKLREEEGSLEEFTEIGSSVHALEEAIEAQKLGATYLTAGHIYLTDCKKGLPARGLDFLKKVCEGVQIPVYGIGGIHFDEKQHREVLSQGAKGVCLMSEYMKG